MLLFVLLKCSDHEPSRIPTHATAARSTPHHTLDAPALPHPSRPAAWLAACLAACRLTCPEAELSKEDRIKLVLQRGRACFDHRAYAAAWPDLAGYTTQKELWIHYADHGQFEGRPARWVEQAGVLGGGGALLGGAGLANCGEPSAIVGGACTAAVYSGMPGQIGQQLHSKVG